MTDDEAILYVTSMIDRAVPDLTRKMHKAVGRMRASDQVKATAISVFLLGTAERLISTEAKAFSGEDDAARGRRAISALEQIRLAILDRFGVGL